MTWAGPARRGPAPWQGSTVSFVPPPSTQDRPGVAEAGILRHHKDRHLPEFEAAVCRPHGRSVSVNVSVQRETSCALCCAVSLVPFSVLPSYRFPQKRSACYFTLWFCLYGNSKDRFQHRCESRCAWRCPQCLARHLPLPPGLSLPQPLSLFCNVRAKKRKVSLP